MFSVRARPVTHLLIAGACVVLIAAGAGRAILCLCAHVDVGPRIPGGQRCFPTAARTMTQQALDGALAGSTDDPGDCEDCVDVPVSVQLVYTKVHNERKAPLAKGFFDNAAQAAPTTSSVGANVLGVMARHTPTSYDALTRLRTVVLLV